MGGLGIAVKTLQYDPIDPKQHGIRSISNIGDVLEPIQLIFRQVLSRLIQKLFAVSKFRRSIHNERQCQKQSKDGSKSRVLGILAMCMEQQTDLIDSSLNAPNGVCSM